MDGSGNDTWSERPPLLRPAVRLETSGKCIFWGDFGSLCGSWPHVQEQVNQEPLLEKGWVYIGWDQMVLVPLYIMKGIYY